MSFKIIDSGDRLFFETADPKHIAAIRQFLHFCDDEDAWVAVSEFFELSRQLREISARGGAISMAESSDPANAVNTEAA